MEIYDIKDNNITCSQYKIVYIAYIGTDIDGLNIYHFLLSTDIENTFSEGWSEKPSGNIANDILMIDENMYEYVKELKTIIKLELAQDNYCFSMQDCRDNIIALAYENIDDYETYPENGRIVIHFGDSLENVESILAKRDLFMKFI